MKKIIAMLLVLTMAVGLVACSNNTETPESTPETTVAPVVFDETAVEVLTTIWNGVAEDKKFFAMGGDMNNMVDNAPGKYDLADEGMTATLLVPQEQIANISDAASLVHGMNLNNFTCGAYKVSGDVTAFTAAMHTAISNNRWMCGMPEKLVIAVIGEFVVVVFGINDAVEPFVTSMTTAYPQAELDYNEAITG